MSRFFAASSGSDTESSEDEQPVVVKQAPVTSRAFVFSDDEEETKRVVISKKDKRFDELQNVIRQLKNHKKIKDMSKVFSEFENLGKAYNKAKGVIDKEGIPQFYIRCLADLEDFVKENWEDTESKKKLNKVNAKSLSTLRQKLKKFNKDFEADIEKYKENPVLSGESEKEESESEDESDTDFSTPKKVTTQFLKKKAAEKKIAKLSGEESDSDDSIDWDNSEEESSSESSMDEQGGPMELTASMFLKKVKTSDKKGKKVKKAPRIKEKEDDEGWIEVKGVTDKAKHLFPKDTEITHEVVVRKLHEILGARGKKGTDRTDQIGFLRELRRIAEVANLGVAMTVKLTFSVISSIFDYNPNVAASMKKAKLWVECLQEISDLLTLLANNPNIVIGEFVLEENESFDKPETTQKIRGCILTIMDRMDAEYVKMLQECDCHSTEYVQRLKDEMKVCGLIERLQKYLETKGTREEMCRVYLLRVEHLYYKIDADMIVKPKSEAKKKESEEGKETNKEKEEETQAKEEKEEETQAKEEKEEETQAKEEKEEETQAKEEKEVETQAKEEKEVETQAKEEKEVEKEVEKVEETQANEEEEPKENTKCEKTKQESSAETMAYLCKYIYSKDTSDRIRTRAMLCHIYHHALHDRWYEARDLVLMSHLQETIQHSDIPTQILYNRTMVQLGLCAFRHGMIRDAHNALHDVQSSGRAKELLAQGLMQQRQYERTAEQEKIEQRRQVPFHIHINLELLECVYLTSAMLIEVPYMAAHAHDLRRRVISKSFHYQLRLSDKQTLVGPPESMREHVVAASKAMMTGDWKKCKDFILAVRVWKLFCKPESVKVMLLRKIQEESLRTYLFTYNSVYDSLSLHTLADMFELPPGVVHSTISKMIINEELQASWDEPTQTVVMHHGAEPTLVQNLALQLAEKVGNLVENNERIYDTKHGGGFFQYKDRQGGGRYRNRNQQQNYSNHPN